MRINLIIFILLFYSNFSVAADYYTIPSATITVSGTVIARACTVSTETTSVELGTFYSYDFIAAQSASAWKEFTLNLTDCPETTNYVKSTFTGSVSSPGNFINNGSSQNIVVQITKSDGSVITNGTSFNTTVNSARNVSIPLKTRIYTENGNPTSGNVSSTINVTYDWY